MKLSLHANGRNELRQVINDSAKEEIGRVLADSALSPAAKEEQIERIRERAAREVRLLRWGLF